MNDISFDLLGLSKPITKLIEVVASGIGACYRPHHIKEMAKAQAEAIRTISSVVDEVNLPLDFKINGENIQISFIGGDAGRLHGKSFAEQYFFEIGFVPCGG